MYLEYILPIVVAVFASTGFWATVQKIIERRKNKRSVERDALLALLHNEILGICKFHISNGSIKADEYENLLILYRPYAKMGGNGTCERLMEEVRKLPIQKGGEEA